MATGAISGTAPISSPPTQSACTPCSSCRISSASSAAPSGCEHRRLHVEIEIALASRGEHDPATPEGALLEQHEELVAQVERDLLRWSMAGPRFAVEHSHTSDAGRRRVKPST